jgi:uncharacterized protein DUF4235
MAAKGGSLTWKLFGTLAAIAAGIAARKALVAAFSKTTGKQPPANPEAPGTDWMEALGWAAASGAAVGLARMLATRKAADAYRKATGHLPKGMEEVS